MARTGMSSLYREKVPDCFSPEDVFAGLGGRNRIMGALIVVRIVFSKGTDSTGTPNLLDTDNYLVSRYLHIQSLFKAANQEESK